LTLVCKQLIWPRSHCDQPIEIVEVNRISIEFARSKTWRVVIKSVRWGSGSVV